MVDQKVRTSMYAATVTACEEAACTAVSAIGFEAASELKWCDRSRHVAWAFALLLTQPVAGPLRAPQ